jgi:hypothetical protein|tara:strand:- start:986 stop:2014 length:1029 start_codon:yes stop_codon:yes gene_type:complete
MTKKKHFFIFVFRHRFRNVAFNNFLKIRKIKNYKIIDLSGFFKYFLFTKILIFLVTSFDKIFKNITLISCDGLPFIKKNAVNIWFGGTNQKIPKKFKYYKNNIAMIRSSISKEKHFVNLYPCFLDKNKFNKKFKIVFVGKLNLTNSPEIKLIWKKFNKIIMNNFSIIEDLNFLKKVGAKDLEHTKKIYLGLKSEIRLSIIKKINARFKNNLIVVGSDWKDYIVNFIEDNRNVEFVRNLYKGNLCLDFGSRWGNNCLYPRSIDIIESSGMLLQLKQSDSMIIFQNLSKSIMFNSYFELLNLILKYKKNYNLLNANYEEMCSLFENNEMNYKTFNQFKKIAKLY